MTKFSVLISVYINENPNFLKTALDTIFNQTLEPTEVVLIKDGLLNKALDSVIEDYSFRYKNMKVYGYNENRGVGYALNFGLKKCKYDLIIRCDSDDINILNRFEYQIRHLKNSDYAVISSNIEEFNYTPGDLNRFRKLPQFDKNIQKYKLTRNPFNHMSVAFKKSLIIERGSYISMPGYEDYYLWLRVLGKYKGYNMQNTFVHARVGNDMIGRRQGCDFIKKEFRFQKQILNDGIISEFQFFLNMLSRVIPRLLPKTILKLFYKLFLRQ